MARERKTSSEPGETSKPKIGDARGLADRDDERGDEEGDLREGEERPGVVPDVFRRMMALGFSSLFSTEAAIRSALGEAVPRDWVDFVSEQSERTREDLSRRFAEEFGRVLEKVDVLELAEQLLAGRTVEVHAQIRLAPREADDDPDRATRGATKDTTPGSEP